MGRPLAGSLQQRGPRSWWVSVPEVRGSKRRIERTFSSEDSARNWLDAAIATLKVGGTVTADLSQETTAPRTGWFAELCHEFYHNRYMVTQTALPDSAEAVLRNLERLVIPYFAARWNGPDDVDWESCNGFAQFLSGRRLADGTVVVATDEETVKKAFAYATSTQGNILTTLKMVLDEAVAKRIIPVNPAKHLQATAPLEGASRFRRQRSGRRTELTLRFCKSSVAPALHLVHQLAMWIQRICGLRISEAFGICVGDINRHGDMGWCIIEAQGGRRFRDWGPIGEVVDADGLINRMKTPTSVRVVVFPPSLMVLIDAVIDAYHTDEYGCIDPDAPLLFGPQVMSGGQASYAGALKAASGSEEDFSSHDLRKRMIHDLAMKVDAISEVKRRVMSGHRAGSDQHGSVYIRDLVDLTDMIAATEHVEGLIKDEIGSLIVPTTKRPLFSHDHPYDSRQARADEILAGRGILVRENRLSTADIGELIGRSEQVAARRCRAGLIAATRVQTDDGVVRWLATREAVEAYIANYEGWVTIEEIEEHLGLTYHQLYQLVLRLELPTRKDIPTRRLLLAEETIEAVRAEVDRVEALRSRSVLISEAAELLGKRRSTIQGWITSGQLTVDPETDTIGQKYITRASIEQRAQVMASEKAALVQRHRHLPRR